jgi:hypothetical protein
MGFIPFKLLDKIILENTQKKKDDDEMIVVFFWCVYMLLYKKKLKTGKIFRVLVVLVC